MDQNRVLLTPNTPALPREDTEFTEEDATNVILMLSERFDVLIFGWDDK